MDWSMLWKDLLAGFLIAGALSAFVPAEVWKALPSRPASGESSVTFARKCAATALLGPPKAPSPVNLPPRFRSTCDSEIRTAQGLRDGSCQPSLPGSGLQPAKRGEEDHDQQAERNAQPAKHSCHGAHQKA